MAYERSSLSQSFQTWNITPIGYSDVGGRPAFKMTIRKSGSHWYLYTGHFWHSGWTILDVTKPEQPQFVSFTPGPPNTATLQVDMHDTIMITALEKILPGFGGDDNASYDEGVLLWDVADPTSPKRLGQFKTGGTGTHRNGYFGGQYVHLAAGMPGYDGNIYVIIDINDPSHPIEVSRWWVDGQHVAAGEHPPKEGISLHGPPEVLGNNVYLPYGSAGMIILDIDDISRPQKVGELPFHPPFRQRFNVHSIVPRANKKVAYVNSEGAAEFGAEGLDFAAIVDIQKPQEPRLLSVFPRPTPPAGSKHRDFWEYPGWSGPHNQNQLQHNPYVKKQEDHVYLTYFNAGLRIFDVSDPRQPREIAWFLPPDPEKRYGPQPVSGLIRQTEDVLVDTRGYIYVSDKNQGIWILKCNK